MYNTIKKQNQHLFILFIMMFMLTGCYGLAPTTPENQINTMFKTLQTAKQFRHTGLSIVGDFYKQGLVSEDKKEEVIEIGNELKEIIAVSFDCLKDYVEVKNNTTLSALNSNIQLYNRIYAKFSDLIIPYLLKEATGDNTNG